MRTPALALLLALIAQNAVASDCDQQAASSPEFSLKEHFKLTGEILVKSLGEIATPGPLIAIASGVGGNLAARPLDQKIRSRYLDPAGRPPKPLLEIGTQLGYGYAAIGGLTAVSILKKDNELMNLSDKMIAGLVLNTGMTMGLKYAFRPIGERPDGSDRLGLPSGHTSTTAMMGTVLCQEKGKWGCVAGAAATAGVAATRIMNNRHYLSQTAAGAGIGIASGLMVSSAAKKITAGKAHVKGKEVRWQVNPVAGEYKGVAGSITW